MDNIHACEINCRSKFIVFYFLWDRIKRNRKKDRRIFNKARGRQDFFSYKCFFFIFWTKEYKTLSKLWADIVTFVFIKTKSSWHLLFCILMHNCTISYRLRNSATLFTIHIVNNILSVINDLKAIRNSNRCSRAKSSSSSVTRISAQYVRFIGRNYSL